MQQYTIWSGRLQWYYVSASQKRSTRCANRLTLKLQDVEIQDGINIFIHLIKTILCFR